MKLKYIPFLIALASLPIPSISQQGYYRTKESALVGIKLIDGGKEKNAKICQVFKANEIITFSPYEVTEYGINKDKIYVAKIIRITDTSRNVFLERLAKGTINLYYYKDKKISTYFIEKDSTSFIELPRKDSENKKLVFRTVLAGITGDCDLVQGNLQFVKYKRNTLKRFAENYNACKNSVFPFTKFGIMAGYNASKLVPVSLKDPDELNALDFYYDGSFLAGVFMDKPIMLSNFSFHPEIYFTTLKSAYHFRNADKEIDLLVNSASLNIPILFRYAYPGMKISPFINAGAIYEKNIKNDGNLYVSYKTGDIIYIEKLIKSSFLSLDEMGLSLGCGLQYRMNHRNSLFFELRFDRKYNISPHVLFTKQEFQLLTGINF